MPLNELPDPEQGNVLFLGLTEEVAVLGPEAAAEKRAEGAQLFLSHFVTCPRADKFRKHAGRA